MWLNIWTPKITSMTVCTSLPWLRSHISMSFLLIPRSPPPPLVSTTTSRLLIVFINETRTEPREPAVTDPRPPRPWWLLVTSLYDWGEEEKGRCFDLNGSWEWLCHGKMTDRAWGDKFRGPHPATITGRRSGCGGGAAWRTSARNGSEQTGV